MPRARILAAALLTSLAAASDADARAAYLKLPEAVRNSEIVAVVDVVEIQDASIVGGPDGYAQRVIAKPIDVLKGELPATFAIAADSDFICAPVPYETPGTYLVFLAHQGDALATYNHSHGRMTIVDETIDWPYDDRPERVSKDPILRKLRALIGRQGPGRTGPKVPELIPVELRPKEPLPPEPITVTTAQPEPEPLPCSYGEAPSIDAATNEESGSEPMLVPLSMVAGAFAVMLGFAVARRRRSTTAARR